MDEQTLNLLDRIVEEGSVSIYDLAQKYGRSVTDKPEEQVLDEVLSSVYYLASLQLVELKIQEGEDGNETIVSSTPFGEKYLKIKHQVGRSVGFG